MDTEQYPDWLRNIVANQQQLLQHQETPNKFVIWTNNRIEISFENS